ncbi:hypothetical protein MYCTH_2307902 [Thermothelomyces thermophilus ATCC 42464]|uniref:Uncharacterized protein n=1 Tax=Thermothelomyces thermophilus (strain ATCC 42464 / BCRC 31852 / DSM 1799) TaxID=573729 RepID=G2QIJ5_THET4|nr:uncharacterized protein MYCTH_2307902 [Thermothelomyces thermophilus ATCC 42464]AEO59526.1 hypothetical protein MYCTH_2307902 [Thermothelomyces thermophilus ATCC 42464]
MSWFTSRLVYRELPDQEPDAMAILADYTLVLPKNTGVQAAVDRTKSAKVQMYGLEAITEGDYFFDASFP